MGKKVLSVKHNIACCVLNEQAVVMMAWLLANHSFLNPLEIHDNKGNKKHSPLLNSNRPHLVLCFTCEARSRSFKSESCRGAQRTQFGNVVPLNVLGKLVNPLIPL